MFIFRLQFNVVPEILNESTKNGPNDSDIIEMVEIPLSQLRRSNRATARSTDAKPTEPTKKYPKQTIPPSVRSKTPSLFPQPTAKRAQRAAAQRAVIGINKSLEDTVYEYAPQRKAVKKPQSPVSKLTGIGSMKKAAPGTGKGRKLWSQEQNQTKSKNNDDSDVDDDMSKKSPMKRNKKVNTDVQLTPAGLRKAIFKDPELQKSQMLKNASRINDDVKRIEGGLKRLTNSVKATDSFSEDKVNISAT